jgi:hypothetical protein
LGSVFAARGSKDLKRLVAKMGFAHFGNQSLKICEQPQAAYVIIVV